MYLINSYRYPNPLVVSFVERVLADGGVVESVQCISKKLN